MMSERTTLEGRGVQVAVIDSGVHASHPHIGGVAGGVAVATDLALGDDYVDRVGHGTAVTAAIREKAPGADIFAVKVFDRGLSTDIDVLVRALDWAIERQVHVINLSLGTAVDEHAPLLVAAMDRARQRNVVVVAAGPQDGVRWLPGSLGGVVAVELDWSCPRSTCHVASAADRRVVVRASGFPRPIPDVPPERNLKGLSFAVANVSGLLACALEGRGHISVEDVPGVLERVVL